MKSCCSFLDCVGKGGVVESPATVAKSHVAHLGKGPSVSNPAASNICVIDIRVAINVFQLATSSSLLARVVVGVG